MLAKGRLLGLQFDTLFTDGLYLKIARHAIDMADRIVEGLKANGYTFYIRPQSNQLFVQLENSLYEKLAQRIGFEVWENGLTVRQWYVSRPVGLHVKKMWLSCWMS